MAVRKIHQFYTDDHHRLDKDFAAYQKFRAEQSSQALDAFDQFRAGLEQHMSWEEAILFPEYDGRFPEKKDVTEELRDQHSQLLDQLQAIEQKLKMKEFDTVQHEKQLLRILKDHNRLEEEGLYDELDQSLTDRDRTEIFQKMEDAKMI